MQFLFQTLDDRILNAVAKRATEYAKSGKHREAAKFRRMTRILVYKQEDSLSYDDLESEEYQSFLSFNATKVVGYSIAAAIFLVTLFFYLTK